MLEISTTLQGERRAWTLDAAVTTIGRASSNAVCLPDATVSKEHARVRRDGERWFVEDAGSRNGTRVNGRDAGTPVAIADGDVIETGQVMLRVSTVAGTAAAAEYSESPSMSSSLRLNAADILNRRTERLMDPARLVRLLSEAGQQLVLPRPMKETCEQVLEFLEKAVPSSRLIILLREEGKAEPVQAAARYRGGSARQPLAVSKTILQAVLTENAAIITADAAHDPRFAGQQSIVAQLIRSAMAVPLFDNERVIGVLYADTSDLSMVYQQEHLELLTILANMAAVKITNARLLEADEARRRMAQELATATRIQRALLPPPPADVPGFECEARLESCFEVGGDLYDFHVRADGTLVVVVGDVSGKGMGAALLMSSVIASARTLYDVCDDPADLAARLNAVIHRGSDSKHFVTMFFAFVRPETGRVRYVNAGHNAPYVVGSAGLRTLEAKGIPIAVLPHFPYQADDVALAPGELLALFSDGIPEAQRGDAFFDDERLAATLTAHAADVTLPEIASAVIGEVDGFLAGSPRTDDVTLVLLRRRA